MTKNLRTECMERKVNNREEQIIKVGSLSHNITCHYQPVYKI